MNFRHTRLAIVFFVLALPLAAAGYWWILPQAGPVVAQAVPAPAPSSRQDAPATGPSAGATPQGRPRSAERPAIVPGAVRPSTETDVATAVPARVAFGSAWKRANKPAFAAFAEWAERYTATPAAGRVAVAGDGGRLVVARRAAMKDLIKSNPREAIAAAVPGTVRAQLPPEIAAQLEEPVSGTGDLEMLGVMPIPGKTVSEPYTKRVTVNGQVLRAYTYGRRESQMTKRQIPLAGVAMDGAMAVSESPLRVLAAGEIPSARLPIVAVCPISGKTTPVTPGEPLNVGSLTAAEVGGKVIVFCQPGHVAEYEAQLIQQENAAGPYPVGGSLNNSGSGTQNIGGRPPTSWSQGTKKVLFIRVDFPDRQGPPVLAGTSQPLDDTFIATQINQTGGVREFYEQGSFSKTTLSVAAGTAGDSPDVTQVFRLPQTASYYAVGDADDSFDGQMHIDARSLAASAGYNLAAYDRVGVIFSDLSDIPGSKIDYGGRANVQGANFWINGYFDFGTVAHELGHTYGLVHSNFWQVSDGNPVSSGGHSVEYGDPFDPMGDSLVTIANHFNQWEKSLLRWIPDTGVTTVSTAGTYRVYRFDHASANLTNALALKIVRNGSQDYWIGYRRGPNTSTLNNGAYIVWGYNTLRQSDLLDFTTPGTNKADVPLAVGATFHDTAAGITIQPLAVGGTSPNQYLDVQVSFDNRIQWSAPSYSFDEKLGPAVFTLLRSGSSAGSVSVNYATVNGTATAPADFTATSGTITWANGDMAPKTVSVPLVADAIAEGVENFSVHLSGVSAGAVVVDGASVTARIVDAGVGDDGIMQDFINSAVEQVVVQADGSMIVGGWFDTVYAGFTPYTRGGFARLHADGTLDTDYGNGAGINTMPVYALALQPDGKAVIGGAFTSMHGVARARVARLHTDGSLDTTFNPGTGPNDEVHCVALLPDGKLLIGGQFTSVSGQARGGVARLNADGTLDTTFAGPTFLGFPNADVLSIAVQADSKVFIAGTFFTNPAPSKSSVARLNANGALDSTFNPGYGAHLDGDNGFIETVNKVAVQRDGKLVVGGYFTAFNNVARTRLVRLNADGSVDSTFNASIDPSVPANTSPYPNVRTLIVQPDNRILIGGTFSQVGGASLTNIARVNADGTLDATFAVGSGSTGSVNDARMRSDGRVVVVADFGTIQGSQQRTLARFYTGLPGLPGTLQFGSPSYPGDEGKTVSVPVSRVGGSLGAVTVNYATQAGTALAARYTPAAGTLSWASGDATTKTVPISLLVDGAAQVDQSFSVNLGIPIGGAILGDPAQTVITIRTPATNITNNGATVSGVVNPGGKATTVRFEYGTTTAYGQTTATTNLGSGSADVPFSFNLTGLLPGTTYHYRLVLTNTDGTVIFADQTFTTGGTVPALPLWAVTLLAILFLVVGIRQLPGQARISASEVAR